MDLKQAESCLFKSYNFLLKNLTCDKECLKEVYKRGALFMERRRVVVTGMGVVSPVGIGVDAFWNALLAGKSGVTPITEFDATDFPVKIAGEVPAPRSSLPETSASMLSHPASSRLT